MNTKRLLSVAGLALLAGLALSACKKNEEENPPPAGNNNPPPSNDPPSTTPSFGDADGVLAAVRSVTTTSTPMGDIDIIMGIASGAFSNDGFSTYANVGTVTCNGEALAAQSNGTYVYSPTASNPTGIDFTASNNVTWDVAGGSGFTGFTRTIATPFPGVDAINSSSTVVRADGYTLTTTAVTNADSVIFTLGSLVRVKPGTATSCTFSASELAGQAAGTSVAQIVGYSYTNETIAGKKIYFVKEGARALSRNGIPTFPSA
ncbi:MAG: hypothetical protein ACK4L7_01140 [Flavobacteriales bacterium]